MYMSRIHECVTMEEEGHIFASLAFVALAQCKHRHYSTYIPFLGDRYLLSSILDVFQQQEWRKAVRGTFMRDLSPK